MTLAWRKERCDARNSIHVVLANQGTHTLRLSDVEGASPFRKQHAKQEPSVVMGPGVRRDDEWVFREHPGHDEKPVHGCFAEAVNPRKNP
jgi:hypothetical protein